MRCHPKSKFYRLDADGILLLEFNGAIILRLDDEPRDRKHVVVESQDLWFLMVQLGGQIKALRKMRYEQHDKMNSSSVLGFSPHFMSTMAQGGNSVHILCM